MTDSVDKKKPQAFDKIGSKVSKSPLLAHAVSSPSVDVNHDGVKDAERLKQIAALHKRIEITWLDQMNGKLALLAAGPARKLGFGPWRKKYPDESSVLTALDAHVRPVFEKLWATPLQVPELVGEPGLHPAWEEHAFEMQVQHDDLKHVAHAYAMTLAYAYFRTMVAQKRAGSALRMPAELVYLVEVNLCQYYVPQGLAAYFEAQPIRALMREVGNRFRKVAFGGQ